MQVSVLAVICVRKMERLRTVRDSTTSSSPTARVCQLCGKCDHEGGQHHESGVQSEVQHGAYHHRGSVYRRQLVDRGHVMRLVRCKFVTLR